MLNLYKLGIKKEAGDSGLSKGERLSVVYHDLFDYPLNFSDLVRWRMGDGQVSGLEVGRNVVCRNSHYYIEGKDGLPFKRLLRKRISDRKMAIARRATKILSHIPSVQVIGVTGSLAMKNATEASDIDLIIITKRGRLWTTRLICYLVAWLFGVRTRKPGDGNESDKLCLNMWLDEESLTWSKGDRNIYTAHEIAQIIPLVNKNKIHERFLWENRWILNFWPNAVRVQSTKPKTQSTIFLRTVYSALCVFLESIAYRVQYKYMKSKITREVVTPAKALFHPNDWGSTVLGRLFLK
jgi:predicted nucleotidyltransferase